MSTVLHKISKEIGIKSVKDLEHAIEKGTVNEY